MAETIGRQMGRKLRPQNQSTRGLRQNQVSGGSSMDNLSVGDDPIRLLDGLVKNYISGFNDQSALGSNRLQDQLNNELVKRGIYGDESGVDISNRNMSDYQTQQNSALAQALVPLYTAMASLAQNSMEAKAGRDYNSQFAREQVNNQLDFQKRMIPINSDAYRTAWNLENSLNQSLPQQPNPYMSAVNSMATAAALNKPLQIGSLEPTPQQPGPMIGGGYDRMNPPPNGWIPTPTDYSTFDLTSPLP